MEFEDQLVCELWARDVRFLMGKALTNAPTLSPKTLLASLAESSDARLRLSLIPLLLRHPEFADKAKKVDEQLTTVNGQLFFFDSISPPQCFFNKNTKNNYRVP